jgi:Xaa-Pro aminopeptidase
MTTHFSLTELIRRREALTELCQRHGLTALIIGPLSGQGAIDYLVGRPFPMSSGYLVLEPAREPALVLSDLDRYPAPPAHLRLDLVADPAATLVVRYRSARLGLIGVTSNDRLATGLTGHGVEYSDMTSEVADLQSILSDEEVEALEASGYLVDRAFERLVREARPGRTECDIASGVIAMALSAGASVAKVTVMRSATSTDGRGVLYADEPRALAWPVGGVLFWNLQLAGPLGYPVSLCRPLAFSPIGEAMEAAVRAAGTAVATATRHLTPHRPLDDIVDVVNRGVGDEGGVRHGRLWPLMPEDWQPQARHVVDLVGWATDPNGRCHAVQADTVLIEGTHARRLSLVPFGTFHPELWNR